MGCGCGFSSCRCGFTTQKPYFTDACQEQSGCAEKTYVCNYSTVIRIQGEWAVPVSGDIITLNVPGLTDIIVGAVIANPDYGSYQVVALPTEEQIKVTRTSQNNIEAGVIIPSCTKFMVSLADNTSYGVLKDWSPNLVGWSLLPTGSYRYAVIGDLCFIYISQIGSSISNSVITTISLPILPSIRAAMFMPVQYIDNGVAGVTPGMAAVSSSDIILAVGTDWQLAGWTPSGTKMVRIQGMYNIN